MKRKFKPIRCKPIKFGNKPFGLALKIENCFGKPVELSEISNESEFLMNEAMNDARKLGHDPSVTWNYRDGINAFFSRCISCNGHLTVYPYTEHKDNLIAGIGGAAVSEHCKCAPKGYKGKI